MTSQQQEPDLHMDSDTRRKVWEPSGLSDSPDGDLDDSRLDDAGLDEADGDDYDNVIVAEVITEEPVTSPDAEDDDDEPAGVADATTADVVTGEPGETGDRTDDDLETTDDLADDDLVESGVIVTTEDPADAELAASGLSDSDVADSEVLAPTEDTVVTEDTAAADDLAIAHELPAVPESAEPVGDQLSESVSEQWHDIQSRFVDDPADAVRLAAEAADAAVSALVATLQEQRSALVTADAGGDTAPDTEQLRSALRECRSFCQGIEDIQRRLSEPQSASS